MAVSHIHECSHLTVNSSCTRILPGMKNVISSHVVLPLFHFPAPPPVIPVEGHFATCIDQSLVNRAYTFVELAWSGR